MLKSHITKVDPRLHEAFKRAARAGLHRYTLQEMSELGMVLVLMERGIVTSAKDALELGAIPKVVAIVNRILDGREW
jgi:hypothetical protein